MFTVETSGRRVHTVSSQASLNPHECRALRFLGAEIQETKIPRLYWGHIMIELLIGVHGLHEQLV